MNILSSELAVSLLPPVSLRVESIVSEGTRITLTVRSLQKAARCPICQTSSARLHSRYRRTLRDLPWGPFPVQVVLRVRRFRCARRGCPRRVFTERLPDLVAPYARSTQRFRDSLRTVGLALGGNPGALRSPASASYQLEYSRADRACAPRSAALPATGHRGG